VLRAFVAHKPPYQLIKNTKRAGLMLNKFRIRIMAAQLWRFRAHTDLPVTLDSTQTLL
jgi:hypothetical protein